MQGNLGKWLVLLGIVLLIAGGILYYFPNALSWIGRLPGDIRIERERVNIYIPFTSMIVLSLVFTLILWIVQWLSR